MAVGVSLAFLQINIVVTALAIGAATTVMAASGMLPGRPLTRSDWAHPGEATEAAQSPDSYDVVCASHSGR